MNPSDPWRLGAAAAHAARRGARTKRASWPRSISQPLSAGAPPPPSGSPCTARLLATGARAEALAEAVDVLAGSPARLEHAEAVVDLGAALRRGGQKVEARERLREGLELARLCGATALVERAHEELITAGARPRRLMFSGVESLTASERRVCDMAAEGQANRDIAQALFVTVKTVENHLTRAYNKLGIASREALPGALAQGSDTEKSRGSVAS